MKKIIILSSLVISIALSAQKKYDFHPEFDEIVNRAETLAFVKKDYISAIELYKSVINTNGDYEDLLRCKFNCYKFLGSIYKSIDFEGHDFNLAYVYLKKAVEARDVFYKKAGFKSNYTSENDDLARRIDMLVKEYPGCENGTYVAQKNASTNSINPTTEVQNSPNTSSNTQIDKPISERTITITVSGSGKTQDEAKQSALRSAIEQAFGTFISAKTEILNDQVISDQITTVASGNIQAYDVLNESQLPDGTWGVTLKAIVSIDKLTSFVEAKGVTVEIKGGLFAQNIKQQILNEQSEIQAVANMVGLLHEPMQTAFDYLIESRQPESLDSENSRWAIPLKVTAKANYNMDACIDYFIKTLSSLSLNKEEVNQYEQLNKQIYRITIFYDEKETSFYLRNKKSFAILFSFATNFYFYENNFYVDNGIYNVDFENNIINAHFLNGKSFYNYSRDYCSDFHYYENVELIAKKEYSGEMVAENKYTLAFPKKGDIQRTYEFKDTVTLQQLEKINNYKVNSRGIQSKFKNGGYVIYEKDGHGMVACIASLPFENYYKIDKLILNNKVDSITNNIHYNGFNDWRLPNVEEFNLMKSQLFRNKIGNLYELKFECKSFPDCGLPPINHRDKFVVKNNQIFSLMYFKGNSDDNSSILIRAVREFGQINDLKHDKHFTIDDLVNYSKSKYGFVDKQGDVNQYFGDLECTSVEKKQFDFTVGCGRGGDIIQISITENSSKPNCFDLYLESGALYFGEFLTAKKKIGELIIISENEIKGSIKLCLEKDSSCCGEEGEDFTLKRISN